MSPEWTLIFNNTVNGLEVIYDYIYDHYVDIYYIEWLAWVFYPLVITFILPIVILVLLYASALFLQFYKLRHVIRQAYGQDFWEGARQFLSITWIAQGRIWFGHEIYGFDKIPNQGPAIIVYYHGAVPVDFYYVLARVIVEKKRPIYAIGDRFLYKIPGFKTLMEVFNVLPGTVSRGIELMQQGQLLAVAPGGVREAYFSDEYYRLLWGRRIGFAKIAVEAKVPVIPMFTQNCREAFRALSIGRSWFLKVYEKTRLPIVPIYGMFPVKLRTFIGDPILPDESTSAEQLADKVKVALEELIKRHQMMPGNIIRALAERFYTPDHCHTS